jgi:branched-chain amino acid transport system ATP-binding protein
VTKLLELRGISRRFGGVRALSDVSIDIDEGAVVGLIGPNGAGKTTLFNVVSGLLAADEGSIVFDGNEIGRLPAYRRAALGIARSFQNLGLMLDETAAVNVLAALHRSRQDTLGRDRLAVSGDDQRDLAGIHDDDRYLDDLVAPDPQPPVPSRREQTCLIPSFAIERDDPARGECASETLDDQP